MLAAWLPDVLAALRAQPALSEVAHDLQQQGLQAYIDIDRTAASRLGITASQIGAVLQSAYSQRQITTLFTQANQYRVILEVDPAQAQGIGALDKLYLSTSTGATVPLSSVGQSESASSDLID